MQFGGAGIFSVSFVLTGTSHCHMFGSRLHRLFDGLLSNLTIRIFLTSEKVSFTQNIQKTIVQNEL